MMLLSILSKDLFIDIFFKDYFLMCMGVLSVSELYVFLVPEVTMGGRWIPWNWNQRQL